MPDLPAARWFTVWPVVVAAALGACPGIEARAQALDAVAEPVEIVVPQILVHQVHPHLLVLSGAGGNIVAWSGRDGVVLVDSGQAGASTAVFETISRVAPGPLRFVINTHDHPDHVGGNELAASRGAVVIGHEALRDARSMDRAQVGRGASPGESGHTPVITTNDALSLHLNHDRLDVLHVAAAHTRGDIVLRWDTADVVDLGDVYSNGRYPFIDVDGGGSLAGMVAAVEATLARATAQTVIIPGHGPVSDRAGLAAYRDMLVMVGRKVRESIEQGRGLDEILRARPTAEFDGQFGRDASVTPDQFIRAVHRDLTEPRSGR